MTPHGHVHWNELNTWDAPGAMAFYAAAFGWRFEAVPVGDETTYWTAHAGEALVAGIFPMTDDFEGLSDHWFTYVAVGDLDAALRAVEARGGRILRAPLNVPEFGRMAVVRDAGGATLGWVEPTRPA